MARTHLNGADKSPGMRYLMAKAAGMDPPLVVREENHSGIAGALPRLSVRADNVDMKKATKASLLTLAKAIEGDLNDSRREAEHWRQQHERAREQFNSESRQHSETQNSLSLAQAAIDSLAKRVAFHHPHKG